MSSKSAAQRSSPTKRSDNRQRPQPIQRQAMNGSMPNPAEMQKRLGNQGTQAWLAEQRIQPKLTIGQPDDQYEQEADRTADKVMRMPDPGLPGDEETKRQAKPQLSVLQRSILSATTENRPIQRLCANCEEEFGGQSEQKLQRKENNEQTPHVTQDVEANINALDGKGSPLPDSTRNYFEPRFGADFSQVRVHTGTQASETAKSINAKAFTVGNNIVFGQSQFAPNSNEGQKLMGHELTHVVQQNSDKLQRKHVGTTGQMVAFESDVKIFNAVNYESTTSNSGELSNASPGSRVFQAPSDYLFRDENKTNEEDASVTMIIDALDGITTANDSSIILSQFQNQSPGRMRAILRGLQAKASEHDVTADGMIDWLFSDMTAEDAASLRHLLIRAGVHAEINRIIIEELYSLLSGITTEADSHEIYMLLVQYTGGGLDNLLGDLASHAEMDGPALGEWLFGDLDRADAERLRIHFLTLGAANAADYAAEFTAVKIESLLSGYTGHADSSLIIQNFRDTPESRRSIVQSKLENKTQAAWSQTAEDALMEDMDREDYEALRALSGINIRVYDYTPTWFEKIISGAEWVLIVAEWLVCGVIGIITGIIGVIWDIVQILWDIVVGIWNLLWSLVYLLTGGTFGSENWLKVKQFFTGIVDVVTNPSAAWDQYWETVGLEYRTIEGPLTDCRRAEYFMRKLTKAVINIVLIFLAGYGIVKGIANAMKTAQAVARLRLLAGGIGNALRLVRLGGNNVDDVARLETLLTSRKIASVGELEALLSHAKIANAIELESLISSSKVQSSGELQVLLDSKKLTSAAELQTLLSNAKLTSAAELQSILSNVKVTSAAEVQAVLNNSKLASVVELQTLLGRAQITSLTEIQALLGHSKVASATELNALLGNAKLTSLAELNALLNNSKISSAAELQVLLNDAKITSVAELQGLLADAKIADAAQLRRILGGTTNVTELNRLLALVDDAAQLERFQAAIGNSTEIERLIRTAGLGSPPVPDSFRLDRVITQMGPGRHPVPAIEAELAAQKEIDSKILTGRTAAPVTPGVTPKGEARRIIGAHSPRILTDPDFRILSQTPNVDGTVTVRFQKVVQAASPGPPPVAEVLSKQKTSNVAPPSWSDNDILRAGDLAGSQPAIQTRVADRATLHIHRVNGVEWAVIKDSSGRITSSFPTGGQPVPF